MNAKTTICTAFMLFSIVAVQPGWAQLIDPATQLRAPVTVPERRLYDLRNPGHESRSDSSRYARFCTTS
jgi:hypothetical protein